MSIPKEAELSSRGKIVLAFAVGISIGIASSYFVGREVGYSQGRFDAEEFFNRGYPVEQHRKMP